MDNGGEFTDRLLHDLGSLTGLSALDVGCGTGEVSFRLAKLVGPQGQVVGIDTNQAAIKAAQSRAAENHFENLAFVHASLFDAASGLDTKGFDLVTCRRVLMYLSDKVLAVRTMLDLLRPAGRLVLQEHDGSLSSTSEALPLNDQVNRMIWDTVGAEGADVGIGLKLHRILLDAGVVMPTIKAEAIVQTPDQPSPTSKILSMMAERIVASGVASGEELDALDLPTLQVRLADERRERAAGSIYEIIFAAVATKPAQQGG